MGKATTSGANDWPCDVLRRGDVLGEGQSRYRVTEYMGEGGCGAVYAAEDVRSGMPVAIKIYSAELSCDALLVNKNRRIEHEGTIVRKFNSSNLPKCYFMGKNGDGRYYFVMERLFKLNGTGYHGLPDKEDEIKEFVLGLLESVKSLHKLRIAHCDIKPENIMRKKDGTIVLSDFGTAHKFDAKRAGSRRRDDENSLSMITCDDGKMLRIRVGTRGFAPPELGEHTVAVDIYEIGHVIRDCFGRDVPLEWSLIINKCIANAKENRYPDIESLERDVRNVDRLGREEMRKCIYEDRLKFMRMQEEMAREKAVAFKWEELKERMENAQSASDAIYAGAGQMFLDFSALSPCRSIRIKDPVALREERFVVIKGPGIIRVNMEAFLADEEGEVIGPGRKENSAMVFLWDNVTLVNTTKKKLEDANVFYVVGDSCYLNFPNVSKKEIFNWDYAVTSNFGFSYAGYHDKKDMASLIRSMNKRLERNIPEKGMMVSAREFFSDGPDMTIRHYIAQNEIMREVLGMPRA